MKIDKLYKDKLKNHSIAPSSRADQLFADRLKQKETKVFAFPYKYIAIAASLLLISGLSFYLYNPTTAPATPLAEVMTKTVEATDKSETSPLISKVDPKVIEETKTKPISHKSVKSRATAKSVEPTIKASPALNYEPIIEEAPVAVEFTKPEPVVNPIKHHEIDELIPDKLALTLSRESPTKKPKKSTDLFDVSAGETLIIISQMEAKKAPVYIPEYNEDSPLDKPFLARLSNEYKHAKEGKKINLEALALNKDGFLLTETQEMKERISWIKNKFSK